MIPLRRMKEARVETGRGLRGPRPSFLAWRTAAPVALALLTAAAPASGARVAVSPGPQGTASSLADALRGAAPGDTLLLGPGLYLGTHAIPPGISLVGVSGPDSTVLDANGGRYVLFGQGLDSTTVISGLTLRNGRRDHPNSGGGGIYLHRSSPIILNNVFRDHLGYLGAGIYGNYGSNPVVAFNTFQDNEGYLGGAIAAYEDCAPLLYNNVVFRNRAVSGGGIMLLNSAAVVLNNTIVGNSAADSGGAAIYCNSSPALIAANVLAHNERGPAVFWLDDSAPAALRRNVLWGHSGGAHGGRCPPFIGRDGNCEEDPGFADWSAGDLRRSPAREARQDGCLAGTGAAAWNSRSALSVPDSVLALWRLWRAEHAARSPSSESGAR